MNGSSPFAVIATASSGLPVSFASTTPLVCSVFGNTVTLVGVGTCTITASRVGNANFSAAAPVARSFKVLRSDCEQEGEHGGNCDAGKGNDGGDH